MLVGRAIVSFLCAVHDALMSMEYDGCAWGIAWVAG